MSFHQTPNRVTPQLAPEHMKTYQVVSPPETHWRDATCAEVECEAHTQGWASRIDETTPLGQRQAAYIRTRSGRRFAEVRETAHATMFVFEAGQQCFGGHRVPLGRRELYVVRDGDWRGNPRGTEPRVHSGPDAWLNDFGDHQERLRRAQG